MRQIPLNFRSPLVPKLLVGSENIWGAKLAGHTVLCLLAKFGVDPRRTVARDEKVRSLLSFSLSV